MKFQEVFKTQEAGRHFPLSGTKFPFWDQRCTMLVDMTFFYDLGRGLNNLQTCFDLTNSFHSAIKFTLDHISEKPPFLDVQVMIEGRKIITSVFSKPADRHIFRHFCSFNLCHTKNSAVFSQFLRYCRICSNNSIFPEKQQISSSFS